MALTTTPLSITSGLSPARCAETAAARPHGPPPTITRSASFGIGLMRRSGYTNRARRQRALYTDDLISTRANADIGDLSLDQRLNAIEIAARIAGQLGKTARVGGAGLPSLKPFVARLHVLEQLEITRELLVHITVRFVAGAERDAIESVEHIEFGHRQIGEAIHTRGVTNHHSIEPAAAPRPSSGCAELVAKLANLRRERLRELGWERTVANTRRIRFDDTDHRVELARRNANAGRRAA